LKINVENLSLIIGKQEILRNVNIDFHPGNLYCVLGKNGAGKSSLFNIIMDLIKPTKGVIVYNGKTYKNIPVELKRVMSFLCEDLQILDELSAFQYLDLVATLYNLKAGLTKMRVLELIQYFFSDFNNLKKKRIGEYSTGMRKRIALCSCFIHDPDFIILDEPFAGLDPESSHKLIKLIQVLRTKHRTILISDHNLSYMKNISPDQIILLEEGNIILNKKSEEIDEHEVERLLVGELLNEHIKDLKKPFSWL
jgi:ABC-type multidrug transport system ATPase subunit